ncbi:acyltransferase [Vibrio tapetis]|uniref:Bacterial transferase hexapeptide family protein n=1 Tax=Vibrio tapetis subsp. tapetis TaxID=1671868 RepID=A0A2N8ZGD1_9VIBR|nr:acyltransferase [Vibrio tapetis]SON50963.1 Bacterial transferase hexapeptide family protein [Vibrio tapetis subsp. tapetis]
MLSCKSVRRAKRVIRTTIFNLLFSRRFKKFGEKVSIYRPDIIEGEDCISIGDGVSINSMCWLMALDSDSDVEIEIGSNTYIGRFSHIVAAKGIYIGSDVLIADKVYISDNIHDYKNTDLPIIQQPVLSCGIVSIGNGAWIGENVSIIGCSVGKNSVIGANSVVTSDIPDFSVAVGSPAKVIKRYSVERQMWERV